MKRETLRHPKTLDLAARLNVDRPTALGYLTLLWDFTADSAIQGNVGKWPNGAIARACDWMGNPDEFIDALVDSGWVDVNDEHRLLIHDWSDHSERWVKLKIEKLKLSFIGRSTERSVERSVEASTGASPPRDRTEPNRTEPNRTKPAQCAQRIPARFGSGSFREISKELLQNPNLLIGWYRAALGRKGNKIPDSCEVRILATALHVLRDSTIENPAAAFVQLVKTCDWRMDHEKDAARVFKSMQQRDGPISPFVPQIKSPDSPQPERAK